MGYVHYFSNHLVTKNDLHFSIFLCGLSSEALFYVLLSHIRDMCVIFKQIFSYAIFIFRVAVKLSRRSLYTSTSTPWSRLYRSQQVSSSRALLLHVTWVFTSVVVYYFEYKCIRWIRKRYDFSSNFRPRVDWSVRYLSMIHGHK